ncbi:MAG: hypothetical protein MI739_05350 [Bacteroidales bacterium]|nr:hypothetical protein [Bacteroidales bacterium]
MKSILFIISIFIFNISVQAQVFPLLPKHYRPVDSAFFAKDDNKKNLSEIKRINKLSYSVSVGTRFGRLGNNTSLMSSYIAPSIDYYVNSRLKLNIGTVLVRNNFNGLQNQFGGGAPYFNSFSPNNYGIHGSAHYQLTEKFGIYGDGAYFKNQSIFDNFDSRTYDKDYKTMSLGFDYKITDNVNFNFQYRFSNGLNPAYNNPFNNRINYDIYSPFGFWDY